MFNCVTGVIPVSGGQVLWLGKSILGLPPHRIVACGIARTYQGIRLFAGMPAYENVLVEMDPHHQGALVAETLGLPSSRRGERAHLVFCRRLLGFVGIESCAGGRAPDFAYGD